MRIYTCAPTPPVPRPAWASAAGSRATTPPGPIRHSAIGRPMRSTNHRRSRGLLRHRSVWQHDRHYSPQGDRPELRSLSRLSKLGGPAHRLRSRGPTPELTDVESLTIEIFGETLGLNSDASIWRYACDHLRDWFPGLGTEWNFVRRCANLCWLNVQDALFHPSRDWNAFFRCRCASTHGRGGISGSGAMVRLRRQAGEVLRLQGADELGRGDLPVVAGHHRRARDA